jgi:iron complex outermembrane receptor protein
MSIHSTARVRLAPQRATTKSLRLTSACLAVLAVAAGAAHAEAQTQPSDSSTPAPEAGAVKEVVVTGIRKSLQDSVAIKRQSDEVVEVISAEDIGKLPDESIADALTRLPGLAGQRVDGRTQNISIRGLAPDFTATLLNGFQQPSTGDTRAAEFDQYPSELINGVEVYKTPDPSLVGQGLAGTVDLHTLNPLDVNKRVLVLNVRGSVNSQGKLTPGSSTWGNRISGAYVDQFFGGKVGVAIGIAHLDAPEQERHYQTWWWGGQGNLTPSNPNAQGVQGSEDYAYSRSVVRDGVMGTLEFKPTSNFHSTENFFYSKFRQSELMRGEEWIEGGNSDANQTITNPVFQTIGGATFNTGGKINEIVPILISDYNTRNEDEFTFISKNTWDVAGWRLGGDLGYAFANRHETQMEQYAQYGPGAGTPDTVTFGNTATTNGFPQFTPGLNYGDASKIYLDCPSPWGSCWGHDGLLHNPTTHDRFVEGKLYGRHDITGWGSNLFKSFEFGADYSDRLKHKVEDDYNLFLKGALNNGVFDPTYTMPLPTDVVSTPGNLNWAGWGPLFGYNPQAAQKYYTALPIDDQNQFDRIWQVEEKLTTLYGKLKIRSEWFGLPVTGNAGLQYVYAEQISQGFDTTTGNGGAVVFKPYTHQENYGEVLPTLNIKFELPRSQFIHLGLSREMSRPRLDDLRANASGGASLPVDPVTQQPCKPDLTNPNDPCKASFNGSGGNPRLRPWLANAFDVTYEAYLNRTSYIALNYYYKELDSYIYQQITPNYNFTGYPNPLAYPIASYYGPFTQPANGKGGHVEGLELSGTLDGKLASPWLDGFGVTGSLAKAWTDVLQNGPKYFTDGQANPFYDPTVPLLGLSGTVASWTVFYEKYGFSARLSERYRSPYYAEVWGLFAHLDRVEIGADRTMDAQLSYDIPWGPLKGVSLLAQAYNLTNEPYRQYGGTTSNPSPTNLKYYKDYGRTILFGFNWKY